MKSTKRFFSLLLLTALLLSLGVCGVGQTALAENAAAVADGSDISAQLNLIYSRLNELKQDESQIKWYYSVTDLNHDGRLEFVAAAQHPADRSTNLKVWEVTTDRSGLQEYAINKDPEESFPDILTDTADTFLNTATGVWSYLCYDNVVISPTEVYTLKCAVNVKDGMIGYETYAVEHTQVVNGVRNVSHTDANGFAISPELYNAAGVNALAGAERSSTSFDWFTAESATTLSRLTDSYMVFAGMNDQTEVFPVPKPEALQQAAAPTPVPTPVGTPYPAQTPVPVPASTPAPASAPAFLSITKNPTNENNRKPGGKATFVACANTFESLSWTFVSPNGGEYSVGGFRSMFPGASVDGEYSTTLTVSNLSADMNAWGAYCTFYYRGQTARTSTAYMYVDGSAPAPAPVVPTPSQTGSFSGYVVDYSYNTVTLYLNDGGGFTTEVGRDICSVSGNLEVGAPCTAYYDGIGARGAIISWVSIQGSTAPVINYGSMSGTAYHDTAFTVYVVLQDGSSWHVNAGLVNLTGSIPEYGCGCTVYYTDYPSESNIYRVDIYGVEETWNYYTPNEPVVVYEQGSAWNANDPGATSWAGLSDGTEITTYDSGVYIQHPDGSGEMIYGATTSDVGNGVYIDYGDGSGAIYYD